MNKKFMFGIGIFAILVFAGLYCFKSNANADVTNAKVYTISNVVKGTDGTIPDFTFTVNGKNTTFKEFTKNKVIFINFWGTWCPPCRAEIPDIIQINKELGNKNFIVIGMASERASDPVAKVTEFASKNGINYSNFIVNRDLVAAFGGIDAVPTTFIVDAKGNIVEKIVGMKDKASFMTSINRVLK